MAYKPGGQRKGRISGGDEVASVEGSQFKRGRNGEKDSASTRKEAHLVVKKVTLTID